MPADRTRVAAVQFALRPEPSLTAFLDRVAYFVRAAAEYQADFVVFPELFATGLLAHLPHRNALDGGRQLAALAPQLKDAFAALARVHRIHVVAGSTLVAEGAELYNVSWLCRPDGSVAAQEKLHVTPNERAGWQVAPGRRVNVIPTSVAPVSIQICYEVEFPEVSRVARAAGAELILVPFCTDSAAGYHRVRACAAARCIENEVYAVLAGTVGNLTGVAHMDLNHARSAILTPSDLAYARDGVAAEAPADHETMIVAELDLARLRRHREHAATHNWDDRRVDLFAVSYQSPAGDFPPD